jgi:DNA-directed RNA polymerase subunit RPC12/RpoP
MAVYGRGKRSGECIYRASRSILWQAICGVTAMVYLQQQRSYQCDHCGSPEVVALSLLYERGTRTQSGPTYWGKSQSFSAQNAAPPRQKGYGGPFLLCGFLVAFIAFWFCAFSQAFAKYPAAAVTMLVLLGGLGLACVTGFALSCRRVSRYNREVFPTLHWNWLHTYRCQRCGKLIHISPEGSASR